MDSSATHFTGFLEDHDGLMSSCSYWCPYIVIFFFLVSLIVLYLFPTSSKSQINYPTAGFASGDPQWRQQHFSLSPSLFSPVCLPTPHIYVLTHTYTTHIALTWTNRITLIHLQSIFELTFKIWDLLLNSSLSAFSFLLGEGTYGLTLFACFCFITDIAVGISTSVFFLLFISHYNQ